MHKDWMLVKLRRKVGQEQKFRANHADELEFKMTEKMI